MAKSRDVQSRWGEEVEMSLVLWKMIDTNAKLCSLICLKKETEQWNDEAFILKVSLITVKRGWQPLIILRFLNLCSVLSDRQCSRGQSRLSHIQLLWPQTVCFLYLLLSNLSCSQ